jgi:hypothetical protein
LGKKNPVGGKYACNRKSLTSPTTLTATWDQSGVI